MIERARCEVSFGFGTIALSLSCTCLSPAPIARANSFCFFESPRTILLMTRGRVPAAARSIVPIVAFDLLYLNGYDLRKLPLTERKALLKRRSKAPTTLNRAH
jgi:hypothetical protein